MESTESVYENISGDEVEYVHPPAHNIEFRTPYPAEIFEKHKSALKAAA